MASNSLASTTKISGTSWNTVWIDDDWTEWSPKAEKPKEYLEFNTPPLALVIAMQEAGKQGYEIHETLKGVGKRPHIRAETVIHTDHQAKAAEIYNYFAKKHTMRRMKGEYISHYMLALDDLCDNRKKIDVEHLAALLSMPRIYQQNRALENVMKGHKSAPKPNDLHFPAFEGYVEFVDSVKLKHSNVNEKHYFFRTPNNYLMRVVVKANEYGATAWDFIVKAGKLHISSGATYTHNIRGYDFNVIQPSPQDFEIRAI